MLLGTRRQNLSNNSSYQRLKHGVHLTAEDILAIANNSDTPEFLFGAPERNDWTKAHANPYANSGAKDSEFYVVIHRSLNPGKRPDFRMLSRWSWGAI